MIALKVIIFFAAFAATYRFPVAEALLKMPLNKVKMHLAWQFIVLFTLGASSWSLFDDVRNDFANADPVAVWQALEDYSYKQAQEKHQQLESMTPRQSEITR